MKSKYMPRGVASHDGGSTCDEEIPAWSHTRRTSLSRDANGGMSKSRPPTGSERNHQRTVLKKRSKREVIGVVAVITRRPSVRCCGQYSVAVPIYRTQKLAPEDASAGAQGRRDRAGRGCSNEI